MFGLLMPPIWDAVLGWRVRCKTSFNCFIFLSGYERFHLIFYQFALIQSNFSASRNKEGSAWLLLPTAAQIRLGELEFNFYFCYDIDKDNWLKMYKSNPCDPQGRCSWVTCTVAFDQ